MWPASKVFPKELFPLGKIPVVVHIVWEFLEAGITDIVIVAAAHNKNYVAALFDRSVSPPPKLANDPLVRRFQESLERCRLSIIEQSGSYGNGTPLLDAARQFGIERCVYAFGDDLKSGGEVCVSSLTSGIWYTVGDPAGYAAAVKAATEEQLGLLLPADERR